jgi:hypothetical protein
MRDVQRPHDGCGGSRKAAISIGWTRRILLRGFIEPCIPTLAVKLQARWVINHDGCRLIVGQEGQTVRLTQMRPSEPRAHPRSRWHQQPDPRESRHDLKALEPKICSLYLCE